MRKIIWSEESELDYLENIDYLLSAWTEKEAQNFIDEVSQTLRLLEKANVEFRKTDYKDIHAVTILSKIILFYRNKSKSEIELLRFWNTQQSPNKINFK